MSFDSDFGAQIDELGAELVGLLLSQELTSFGGRYYQATNAIPELRN